MNKSLGMLIKIIIIIVVFIFLWFIFRKDNGIDEILDEIIEDIRTPAPQGEYCRVEDILIIVKALTAEVENDALLYRLTDQYKTDIDAKLTYQDFHELTTTIDIQVDGTLADKYQPEHYFLLVDWQPVQKAMIDQYNNSVEADFVEEIIFQILGMEQDVISHEGKVLSPNQLLTGDMVIYDFQSSIFRLHKYKAVRALIKAEELLIVTDVIDENMTLANVFYLGEDSERIGYFYRDYEMYYQREKSLIDLAAELLDEVMDEFTVGDIMKEQLADLFFCDGNLREIHFKNDVKSGKLLAVDDESITIEGQGIFEIHPDMQIYRLFDRMRTMTPLEMAIGYDFTDFVLENGTICGALIVREEAMDYIRVALKTNQFAELYHSEAKLSSDVDYLVTYGAYDARKTLDFEAGEILSLDMDSDLLTDGSVIIAPKAGTGRITLLSLSRSQGTPVYRGTMEIKKTKEGLAIISEVLLEEYLYSVVPSEMPASYPLEALKAQAICARTYAYRFLLRSGLAALGAHVDDSVGYQVYNNIAENMNTTKAVKETTGLKLFYQNNPAGTYYYSTSSGNATIAEIWKSDNAADIPYLRASIIGDDRHLLTDSVNRDVIDPNSLVEEDVFAEFILGIRESDYEKDEPWYRWSYEVSKLKHDKIAETIKTRYDRNYRLVLTLEKGEFISKPIGEVGEIKNIYPVKRLPGGVMDELIIETTKSTYKIISENTIRYVLNDGDYKVKRQDGSEVNSPNLLPSAFMTIEPTIKDGLVTGYQINGGGYGHGVGMSQNGARALGNRGYTCEEILEVFYQDCEVKEE